MTEKDGDKKQLHIIGDDAHGYRCGSIFEYENEGKRTMFTDDKTGSKIDASAHITTFQDMETTTVSTLLQRLYGSEKFNFDAGVGCANISSIPHSCYTTLEDFKYKKHDNDVQIEKVRDPKTGVEQYRGVVNEKSGEKVVEAEDVERQLDLDWYKYDMVIDVQG